MIKAPRGTFKYFKAIWNALWYSAFSWVCRLFW